MEESHQASAATPAADTRWIDLTLIDLPAHARPHNPDDVEALAEDMKINGQLQEIVVAPKGDPASSADGRFEVCAGVGRTTAARKLGWERIRCFVRNTATQFDRLHITFSENEERENASPLYQSGLLKQMMEADNLSQEQLSAKIGKTRGSISQYLMLSQLAPEVQEIANRLAKLGMAHLLQLCRLTKPEDQLVLAQQAAQNDWSVKELKEKVDRQLKGVRTGEASAPATRGAAPPSASNPFQFKSNGNRVAISATYDRNDNLDGFLTKLRDALATWCLDNGTSGKNG